MEVFRRFALMFLASVLVFLLLSSLDEYNSVIGPFLIKIQGEKSVPPAQGLNTENIRAFIQDFNSRLSDVYLRSDPDAADALQADEALKKAIADDIRFLARSNKVMEMVANDIVVEGAERFPPDAIRVKTREVVSLSYLNLLDRAIALPVKIAEYQMLYTLRKREGGWIVDRYETVGIQGEGKELRSKK